MKKNLAISTTDHNPEFLHKTDDIDNDGHLQEILVEMS